MGLVLQLGWALFLSRQSGTIYIYIYAALRSLGGKKRAQSNYSYKAQ